MGKRGALRCLRNAGLAGLGALIFSYALESPGLGKPDASSSVEPKTTATSRSDSNDGYDSLASLLEGKDKRGQEFRTRLDEAGFQIVEYKERGALKEGESPRDVVILGGPAITNEKIEKEIAGMLDFLIERYGFDSVGLPLLYGPPRKKMEEGARSDFYNFVNGANWLGDHSKELPSIEKQENFLVRIEIPASLRRFAEQESVPTFGIEDKPVSFESFSINGLFMCLNYAIEYKKAFKSKYGFDIPYEQIPSIEKFELFVSKVMRNFPGLPYPGKDIEDMIKNLSGGNADTRGLYQRLFEVSYIEGGRAVSRNIQEYMEKLNSKRCVAVVDVNRLLPPELLKGITARMVSPDYKIPPSYIPIHRRLGDSYSFLVCGYFDGAEKKDTKKDTKK